MGRVAGGEWQLVRVSSRPTPLIDRYVLIVYIGCTIYILLVDSNRFACYSYRQDVYAMYAKIKYVTMASLENLIATKGECSSFFISRCRRGVWKKAIGCG